MYIPLYSYLILVLGLKTSHPFYNQFASQEDGCEVHNLLLQASFSYPFTSQKQQMSLL